jgi:two-component system, OmpR family, sensor kinase
VNRLPIRLRLALAFALAMAVVLAVVGALLYVRLGNSLDEQLDERLLGRGEALSAIVESSGGDLRLDELRFVEDEDGFAQLIGPDSILAAIGYEARSQLLTEEELTRARTQTIVVERSVTGIDGESERARLRATPVTAGDGVLVVLVVLVGASLEDRDEALAGLLAQLVVVGPLALLLSSLAGYFLAGAALRPVEDMRRQAAEISSERPGTRLPLPPARDEIRSLGETLNAMLGRLEAGLARERRFVADASHELRTPLALLRTELELASRRPRSREELEQALRSAREEVERLVRLAEDLLVLARADDGRLPLRVERHSVRELLDAVAGRFDSRAGESGRVLEVVVPEDRTFTGDRLRLEQALGNLVDNALRHGAGTVRLEGGAAAGDGLVELRVSDDGPGFPAGFLPHAFERFSRGDVARAGGGAGLGLAIADAIARAHGGSAAATNRAGGGAEIVLLIAADGTHPTLI